MGDAGAHHATTNDKDICCLGHALHSPFVLLDYVAALAGRMCAARYCEIDRKRSRPEQSAQRRKQWRATKEIIRLRYVHCRKTTGFIVSGRSCGSAFTLLWPDR